MGRIVYSRLNGLKRGLRSRAGIAVTQGLRLAGGFTVRVPIVDDEPLARLVLRLRKFRDIEIVGECGDGASAVELLLELDPDVVFLDVQCRAWFESVATGSTR